MKTLFIFLHKCLKDGEIFEVDVDAKDKIQRVSRYSEIFPRNVNRPGVGPFF